MHLHPQLNPDACSSTSETNILFDEDGTLQPQDWLWSGSTDVFKVGLAAEGSSAAEQT